MRHLIGTKRQRHTLGAYPAVSLGDARKRAGEYLAAARDGSSPEEVNARMRAETLTVAQAHEEYMAGAAAGLRPGTRALKAAMFRDHVAPAIGSRLIRTVRRSDVIEIVGAVVAKGFSVQANRVFAELMAMLRWAEQRGYLDGVPSIRKRDLRGFGAAREQPRRRTLLESEVGEVWRTAGELGDSTGDFLRLLLLLGQRRDEVRLMSWSEIDLDNAIWTIPASRYKTGLPHAVPLPDPAMAILRRRRQAGTTGFVLAGRKPDQPFNGSASALRRLRQAMPTGRAPFVLHDLRRTLRSGLARLGIEEETAELVIGHVPQGMLRVYVTYDHLAERREALARWAGYVLSVGEAGGNIVPLVRA